MKRGFTLVELLVVLVVVALLAGLMVPALGHALALARQGQCASNLRQIGTALHGFAADNEMAFPRVGFVVALGDTDPDTGLPSWMEQLDPYTGGNRKIFQCPAQARRSPNHYYLSARAAFDTAQGATAPVRLLSIAEPAKMMLAADCTRNFREPDADKDDCGSQPECPAFFNPRLHPRGANVLFVDGRVEAFKAYDKHRMTVWYEGTGWDYGDWERNAP